MWMDHKRLVVANGAFNCGQPSPYQGIQRLLEARSVTMGELLHASTNVIVQRNGGPHTVIMMLNVLDVKMLKLITFRDWRIRNTFADGINLCNGVSNSQIVNCTARNNGDDAFAWVLAHPG
jgi:hypothetical protein